MAYHWKALHAIRQDQPPLTPPSALTATIAEGALLIQPWWGFAPFLAGPTPTSSKESQLRAWYGTTSFQIVGSLISAALYHIVFICLQRSRRSKKRTH